MTLRVGILVFDDFDLIDAGGPYEVFLTASRLRERAGMEAPFEVVMMSPGGKDVTAFGGMTLTQLVDTNTVSDLDVLVVPGTIDLGVALSNEPLLAAVRHLAAESVLPTSVCTGSFLFARAGALQGLPATSHWEDVDGLAEENVSESVAGVRWVDAGDVITSGGLTSGIHMALHVVSRLVDEELATATARQLDMDWSPRPAR
ncbi:DJ-1/PfpI family protein [Demequina sediminicola]|uniref:DJ-1/PfpI family protein n=1 Tax=Demequina sediminicola TaxID=1095026 RepID=UPI00078640E7|nr:DJ-1/PfpI family protein [Demequina sediminicola]